MRSLQPLGAAALLGVVPLAQAADDLYAVDFGGNVYTLDSTTGAATTVGPSGFSTLNSLAADSAGVLYTATGTSSVGVLITLDLPTGAGTSVASFNFGATTPDVRSMAFRPGDNALFAINAGGPGNTLFNEFYRIDASTGVGIRIATLGNLGVQGLDFNGAGTLYGWSNPLGLITIDAATGAVTDVNAAYTGAVMQSITFAGGALYGASTTALYSIDVLTGAETLIADGLSGIRGIESLAPVPEPATWALWLLGAAAVVGVSRQRARR